MGRIFVARHAESEANVRRVISNRGKRYPLTEQGRAQAIALAQQLAVHRVAGVYSSPLLRARETADYVAAAAGLATVIELDELREPDMGELEDRDDEAAWKMHAAVRQRWAAGEWHARARGGESLREAYARMSRAVWQMAHSHPDDDVVAITHGSLIADTLPRLCAEYRGFDADPHHTAVLVVSNRDGALFCEPLG